MAAPWLKALDVPAKDKGSVPHTRLAPDIHMVHRHTTHRQKLTHIVRLQTRDKC